MITIPPAGRPALSVVMVTYGAVDWVRRSLRALVDRTPRPFELIVVDNASPDETPEFLERELRGARVILNDENLGFAPAVNQGAFFARAPALCLLNSDVLVREGWLAPLLARLETPAVGAVAPRLLNTDGSLQEAGCVVGRDGRTVSLGYGEEPDRPWWCFPHEVAYASAACMVLRRSAFDAVGGFDVAFAPGYYEDVDLCFRLADHGWCTVHEPASVVEHERGASSSNEWAQSLIDAHRAEFVARWGDRLEHFPLIEPWPVGVHRLVHARDAEVTARILVLGDAETAERLAASDPTRRVTLATDQPGRPGAEIRGVEVVRPPVDWDEQARRRRLLYDVVVGDTDGPWAPIVQAQPQAVHFPNLPADPLTALAEAGIA